MSLKRRTPSKELTGTKVALIDGDIIRYQAASVSDKVSYTCLGSPPFKYKKDMVAYCNDHNLPVEQIEKAINPEPVSHCLHTVKKMMYSIMEKVGAGSCRVFLTGEGNYREDIDSRHPYKGNRPEYKPTHFETVGDYLISHFHAEVVDGMEADDAMGIAQWGDLIDCFNPDTAAFSSLERDSRTVICTLDKDLKMIPGWHYSWNEEKMVWINEDEADLFFYKQLLAGDQAVDNIHGIRGIGLKTAGKILAECPDNISRYKKCLEKYEEAGMDYYDLLENSALLWIQREKGVLWNPPKN